ncbi:MAG: RloB domain-containing protein [Epulopiscium sp.]|nr:RloB domain-containing protein [Candidatus Epulonipiscium sp.]
MRIPKTFGQRKRTKKSNEAMRKYFLIFEGDQTEVQYFEGINNYRNEIGISPLIEIKPLLRSYTEKGWSNPKKLLNRLIEYVNENTTKTMTVHSFSSIVVDFLLEENLISKKSLYGADDIFQILLYYFYDKYKKKASDPIENFKKASQEAVFCLRKKVNIITAVDTLSHYLKNQHITYAEGFDKICLIVDRDKESFVSYPHNDQYEYVKNTCKAKGYGFYLTNPCFEFWLLLHFDIVFKIDEKKLLENPKVTSKKTYAEHQLKKVLPKYKKNNIQFPILKDRIDTAIKNEKFFCEDIDQLKNNIGSNIGLLLTELKNESKIT